MLKTAAYVLALLSLFLALPIRADEKKLPDKMPMEMATKLDAAVAHEMLIYKGADFDAAPFEKQIQDICKAFQIPRAELGKSYGVDVATGKILRPAPPPAPAPKAEPAKAEPKPAPAAAPPPKKK